MRAVLEGNECRVHARTADDAVEDRGGIVGEQKNVDDEVVVVWEGSWQGGPVEVVGNGEEKWYIDVWRSQAFTTTLIGQWSFHQ